MSPCEFSLSITMLSDWHIGSGQGRHRSIDRLIDRDHDDLPYIPAATARGIWRDAAQLLAHALDEGQEERNWARLVDQIFGSEPNLQEGQEGQEGHLEAPPLASRITLADARLPENIQRCLVGSEGGRPLLRQAMTFVKPGVGIEPRSGRAKENFLRFEEVARGGAVLTATGELDCPGEERRIVVAFLVGAAALIERLGGKRRRGMGKCTVATDFGDGFAKTGECAAHILEAVETAPNLTPPPWVAAAARRFSSEVRADADEWTKIPLRLTLLSPLVAADEVRGNVVTCRDSIPAGMLFAPIASRLEKAGIADFWSRISSGDIRVLPATPEIAGQRGLPVPLCWEERKERKASENFRLVRDAASDPGTQYKPLREGFVLGKATDDQKLPLLKSVNKVLRTHNTIKDDIQRPHEDVGGVYTYEALAAKQIFRTELWLRGIADVKEKNVGAKMTGTVRLGRARQAGYGRVELTALPEQIEEPIRRNGPNTLGIWLASDAVISSDTGDSSLECLAEAIAETLGGKAEKLFDLNSSWGNLHWRRIESWQTRWGLPRPTLVVLEAGSVAEFALRNGVKDEIGKIEREGIGGRRGEGFGCVIANHSYLCSAPDDVTAVNPVLRSQTPATEEAEASAFLTRIARNAWQRWIAMKAEIAVGTTVKRESLLGWIVRADSPGDRAKPSMSQLGALRGAMGELSGDGEDDKHDTDELANAKRWLDRAITKDADKWPGNALQTLKEWMERPETIWSVLGVSDGESGVGPDTIPAVVPGFEPRTDLDLQRFAIRTLIRQAMRFHKRAIESASGAQAQEEGR